MNNFENFVNRTRPNMNNTVWGRDNNNTNRGGNNNMNNTESNSSSVAPPPGRML